MRDWRQPLIAINRPVTDVHRAKCRMESTADFGKENNRDAVNVQV